ncbi:MAG: SpoIIE family protein phosphatase [Planctomycetota bacterium]
MRGVLTDPKARLAVVREILEGVSKAEKPNEIQFAFRKMWKLRPVDLYVSASQRGLRTGEYKITRKIVADEAIRDETVYERQNPWRDWDTLPVQTEGVLAPLIASAEPQIVDLSNQDLSNDPALGDLACGMQAVMATPIFDRGRPLNWAFQFSREADRFDEMALELHMMIANLAGTATRNLVAVHKAEEMTRQVRTQFEEVARVQQSLLPKRLPQIPGLSIATSYLTSDAAGGDYYDFFPFEDGRWGILIADVAGHGAAAATVMAMLHAILHAYEGSGMHPHLVLEHANTRLVAAGLEGAFTTAFLAIFDPATGELQFSRAGHNPPRWKRGATGDVEPIDEAATLPLGVFEPLGATSASIRLEPGDTVVLYTDGITEAFDVSREMFGVKRLDTALTGCSGQPGCVVDSVHGALFEHTKRRTRDDDQTLVAIHFTGIENPRMPTINSVAGVLA